MFKLPKALESVIAGVAAKQTTTAASGYGTGPSRPGTTLKYQILGLLPPALPPNQPKPAMLMLLD